MEIYIEIESELSIGNATLKVTFYFETKTLYRKWRFTLKVRIYIQIDFWLLKGNATLKVKFYLVKVYIESNILYWKWDLNLKLTFHIENET